jgi:hypothetical protein
MKTKVDNDKYDAFARSFLATLTKYIESDLEEVKLSKKEKKELAQSITFSVATLLDGTGSLEHKKKQLIPHLAFALVGAKSAVIDDGAIALHELCEL